MDDLAFQTLWKAMDNLENVLQDGIYHITFISNDKYMITLASGKQVMFDRNGQAEDFR